MRWAEVSEKITGDQYKWQCRTMVADTKLLGEKVKEKKNTFWS